jgi:enediyne biosynthesis protein E4
MRLVTRGRRGWIALGLGVALIGVVGAILLPRVISLAPSALPAPRFVEEATAAGLEHRYDGEFMFFVGGGVAIFDCDGDGRQDLYIAGGEEPAALFRNESSTGGALAFVPITGEETALEQVVGAYPLDLDGDGIDDLAVLRVGENVLLRGRGDCTFERANEAWGYDGGSSWTAAFSATWESPDTLPTLAFGNYLVPASVEERTYVCDEHELVRPDADGSYAHPTVLEPGFCTLSVLFSDWDRSGRRDLRVSNDRHYSSVGQEQLWRIEPGVPPRPWTREEGWQAVRIWGMGIASHDLSGDGYPEVYLTSQADNRLQILADGPQQPTYEDIAIESNANAGKPYSGDTELPSTAWHAEFQDANNDGFVDLFVSKGNVEAQPDYAAQDPSSLLIGQADGTFVEGGKEAGITSFERARGAGMADLNLDGLLDLVVVNRRANVGLWRNVGSGSTEDPEPMGNWIALQLTDDGANRDAIGAWVEVTVGDRVQRREVTVGGGHAGGQLGWIHFGIGEAEGATVAVTWPDGETGQTVEVEANSFSTLERGAAAPIPWQPAGG